jgi:16S rRNA (guanine(1405)-N(7))-methyltransferase
MPDPDAVAAEVLASRRYSELDPSLVVSVSRIESPKERRLAEAVKRVKRKLHQMVGAYLDTDLPVDAWTTQLAQATPEARPELCRTILAGHASTRERLPELSGVLTAAFEGLREPRHVADLACGLGPIARPLMPLPATTVYRAFDVHRGLVRFVGNALQAMGYPVEAGTWNLLDHRPPPDADVTLLLKTLPCLDQADQATTRRLLESVRSPVVVVTFPTVSLGGTRRGMGTFYRERFLAAVPPDRFRVEIREFRTELMFRLHRLPLAGPLPEPLEPAPTPGVPPPGGHPTPAASTSPS